VDSSETKLKEIELRLTASKQTNLIANVVADYLSDIAWLLDRFKIEERFNRALREEHVALEEENARLREALHLLLNGGDFAAWLNEQSLSWGAAKELEDAREALEGGEK
jgi:hypothetical protein